jgi:hypothetical protein
MQYEKPSIEFDELTALADSLEPREDAARAIREARVARAVGRAGTNEPHFDEIVFNRAKVDRREA